MARDTAYKPEYCDRAIEILSRGYNSLIALAAELGVVKSTINNWRKENPDFEFAIQHGKACGEANYEKFAHENMCNKEFNDKAWAAIMRRNYQDAWDRKVQIEGLSECTNYDEEIDCIMRNVASGNLTPVEAERMSNIIKAKVYAFEMTKVKPLIEKLEAQEKVNE